MMNRIEASLTEFGTALQESAVVCDTQGNWIYENAIMRVVRRIFHLGEGVLAGVGRAFNQCLDKLEEIPIHCNADGHCAEVQRINFQEYLDTAKIVEQVLERSHSQKVLKELNSLKNRIIALRYRLEKETIVEANEAMVQKIGLIANKWKESRHIFDYKPLNSRDWEFIKAACSHKDFAKRLLEDTQLQKEFFRWSIQDCCSPEVFIQYPGLQKNLVDCALSTRIGYHGGEGLRIQKISTGTGKDAQKVVTLPFEGKEMSILDAEEEVRFSGGFTLKMQEIFAVFKARQKVIGELEFFQDGIRHFNPKRIYDFVDLEKEKWWEDLFVLKEISVEEAQSRYQKSCDGKDWVIEVKASREHPDLRMIGTHVYLEMAIPYKGKYRIYTFGKLTETFPIKWYEYIDVFANTLPAIISYPDDNTFYTNRQHIGYSALATFEEGQAFMACIKKNILDSKNGNLVFQIGNENCSKWALKKAMHHLGTKRVPDLFGTSFTDIKFPGVAGTLFSFFRKMPHFVGWLFFTIVVIFLGGWRGKTMTTKNGRTRRISLLNDMPWDRGKKFLHPGRLFTSIASL